jgi:energy-coupling factor transporter ATP-binding protein EcfA2
MAGQSATVILPNGEQISGDNPIVVLGPNGSGKTRLARALQVQLQGGTRSRFVAAARLVSFGDNNRTEKATDAIQAVQNSLAKSPSMLMSDAKPHLDQLLKSHREALARWNESTMPGALATVPRPVTAFDRVRERWNALFPLRKLILTNDVVNVEYESGVDQTFIRASQTIRSITNTIGPVEAPSLNGMSDGEKGALYHILWSAGARHSVYIVDEPEICLHTELAVHLWDDVEMQCKSSRFVYITHRLDFALSRTGATWVICEHPGKYSVVESSKANLPEVATLIGARTFALCATRIVFVEGTRGGIDDRIYGAWYSGDRSTAVHAIGGHERVVGCVRGLANDPISAGIKIEGIIDRDDRSDDECEKLRKIPGLHITPAFELESLLAHRTVFCSAYCEQWKTSEAEANGKYNEAVGKTQKALRNKVAERMVEQAKDAIVHRIRHRLDDITQGNDVESSKKVFIERVQQTASEASLSELIEDIGNRLEDILGKPVSDGEEILSFFPGKDFKGNIADAFRVKSWVDYEIVVADLLKRCVNSKTTQENHEHLEKLFSFFVQWLGDPSPEVTGSDQT